MNVARDAEKRWEEAAKEVASLLPDGEVVMPLPDPRHVFKPDKKHPWFCRLCGYGPRELLMHLPAS